MASARSTRSCISKMFQEALLSCLCGRWHWYASPSSLVHEGSDSRPFRVDRAGEGPPALVRTHHWNICADCVRALKRKGMSALFELFASSSTKRSWLYCAHHTPSSSRSLSGCRSVLHYARSACHTYDALDIWAAWPHLSLLHCSSALNQPIVQGHTCQWSRTAEGAGCVHGPGNQFSTIRSWTQPYPALLE